VVLNANAGALSLVWHVNGRALASVIGTAMVQLLTQKLDTFLRVLASMDEEDMSGTSDSDSEA
jgi:hypothetical protein